MGCVRDGHAYKAPCKTYADGEYDNQIIWYYVDDDAPLFEGVNAFEPRVDNIYDVSHATMEKCALRPCPRKHYSGRDVWDKNGLTVDGDEEDFAGRALKSKHWVNGIPPVDPCDAPPLGFNEFGLKIVGKKSPTVRFPSGVELATVVTRSGLPAGVMGIELGTVGLSVPPSAHPFPGALEIGGVLTRLPASPLSDGGIELGALLTPATAVVLVGGGLGFQVDTNPPHYRRVNEFNGSGLLLCMADADHPPWPRHKNNIIAFGVGDALHTRYEYEKRGGLELGGHLTIIEPVFMPFDQGIEFGLGIVNPPPVEILDEEAIEFGSHLTGPPSPGVSCEGAFEITLGVEYTFPRPTATSHWYKFAIANGVEYHVKLISAGTEEETTPLHIKSGESCAGLTDEFDVAESGDCGSFTASGDEWGYIESASALFGGGDYTFVVDTGPCP